MKKYVIILLVFLFGFISNQAFTQVEEDSVGIVKFEKCLFEKAKIPTSIINELRKKKIGKITYIERRIKADSKFRKVKGIQFYVPIKFDRPLAADNSFYNESVQLYISKSLLKLPNQVVTKITAIGNCTPEYIILFERDMFQDSIIDSLYKLIKNWDSKYKVNITNIKQNYIELQLLGDIDNFKLIAEQIAAISPLTLELRGSIEGIEETIQDKGILLQWK